MKSTGLTEPAYCKSCAVTFLAGRICPQCWPAESPSPTLGLKRYRPLLAMFLLCFVGLQFPHHISPPAISLPQMWHSLAVSPVSRSDPSHYIYCIHKVSLLYCAAAQFTRIWKIQLKSATRCCWQCFRCVSQMPAQDHLNPDITEGAL